MKIMRIKLADIGKTQTLKISYRAIPREPRMWTRRD